MKNLIENKAQLCQLLTEIINADSTFTIKNLTADTTNIKEAAEKALTVLINKASALTQTSKAKKANMMIETFIKYHVNVSDVYYTLKEVYAVYSYLKASAKSNHVSMQMTSDFHTCDMIHEMELVKYTGGKIGILVNYNENQMMTWDCSQPYKFTAIGDGRLSFEKGKLQLPVWYTGIQ